MNESILVCVLQGQIFYNSENCFKLKQLDYVFFSVFGREILICDVILREKHNKNKQSFFQVSHN